MELGLSLGDASKPFSSAFMDKARDLHPQRLTGGNALDFSMGLSIGPTPISGRDDDDDGEEEEDGGKSGDDRDHGGGDRENGTQDLPVQLELLPNTPVPRYPHAFPWPSSDNGSSEAGSSGQLTAAKGLDVNKAPAAAEEEAGGSSPNSAASSFQMDFGRNGGQKRDSDEDENGNTRKKLRLSKEQSVFLEESFKEHNTLNPKQKLALAKQLNLRPRQVEVWFQNRRARTKLKQTEVDCEYLKRCCETLTEENRRLQKEVQELRALKTSNPFYMQLPATTLTMCPSCERVATNTAAAEPIASNSPRFYPLPQTQNHHHPSKTC